MKGDVVAHHRLRLREVGPHSLGKAANFDRLRSAAPQRRQSDRARLNGPPNIVDLLNRHLVGLHRMVEHQRQHCLINAANAGAPPIANFNDAERRQ